MFVYRMLSRTTTLFGLRLALCEKNVDLYITGSNAFLLSGELATLLSGRYIEIKMLPLSFREYIIFYGEKNNVVEYVLDNIGNLSSATKIVNVMTSGGRKISVPTVESYLEALANSFVIYKVGRYDVKGKQHLVTGAKYYVTDIGMRYYLLGMKAVGNIIR